MFGRGRLWERVTGIGPEVPSRRAGSRVPGRTTLGAGDGNRTRVPSLGSSCSTIELHPRTGQRSPHPTPVVWSNISQRMMATRSQHNHLTVSLNVSWLEFAMPLEA